MKKDSDGVNVSGQTMEGLRIVGEASNSIRLIKTITFSRSSKAGRAVVVADGKHKWLWRRSPNA